MIIIPNWCANNIVIQGKGKDVKQFILDNFKLNKNPYNKDDEYKYILDFEQFDPTPLDENGDVFNDWYSWRLEHWGCKWSPCYEQCISLIMEEEGKELNIIYDDKRMKEKEVFSEEFIQQINITDKLKLELTCYCDTPWGPPEGIFMQWYEKYKELDLEASIKFYEPGCVFAGEMWFSKDDYCINTIDDSDTKEWILYLLTEGWESIEWYIDECNDMIQEMHNVEEAELISKKVAEILNNCNLKEASILIADIFDKYFKYMHEGDENNNESSKE